MATCETTLDITQAMRSSSLFDQIPEEKFPRIQEKLKARKVHFDKHNQVKPYPSCKRHAGILLSGVVEIGFLDEGGNQITIKHVHQYEAFGMDQIIFSKDNSPFHIVAVCPCVVLFLDFSFILDNESPLCPHRMQLLLNLVNASANENQYLCQRLRINNQKRLRDKIKVYLQAQPVDARGRIHLPFNRAQWANFLYADRSALSRELARMSDDGLISYQGSTIKITDPNFLFEF